ncbi:MAG: hypothetical protein COA78_07975 [Blastopirellula sp.]|nr:MAG: hypothetical protein COA78_07975 [Blastopirellula sp.]
MQTRRQSRKGIQVLELLIAFPVLFIASIAFFQFGPAMVIHEAVQSAAEESAREAAKRVGGQTVEELTEETMNDILGVHGLALGDAGIQVIIEQDDSDPDVTSEVICLGDTVIPCPVSSSITSAEEIKITIIVSMEDGMGNKVAPVPNVLKNYGIDFSQKYYEFSAIARKDS